jgi:hypothetical protein
MFLKAFVLVIGMLCRVQVYMERGSSYLRRIPMRLLTADGESGFFIP